MRCSVEILSPHEIHILDLLRDAIRVILRRYRHIKRRRADLHAHLNYEYQIRDYLRLNHLITRRRTYLIRTRIRHFRDLILHNEHLRLALRQQVHGLIRERDLILDLSVVS